VVSIELSVPPIGLEVVACMVVIVVGRNRLDVVRKTETKEELLVVL
jgi:hypothetical protein